jgi:hypothetical protein
MVLIIFQFCEENGGILAEIHNAKESEQIAKFLAKQYFKDFKVLFWIGLTGNIWLTLVKQSKTLHCS